MNAIIFFDDQPQVVRNFVVTHLAGKLTQTEMFYVKYHDAGGVRKPLDIARDAHLQWVSNAETYERTVFVLDLNPDLPTLSLNSSFLHRVLMDLAQQFGGMDIIPFLGNANFLASVLTKFPDAFADLNGVTTIEKPRTGDLVQQVAAAMGAINQPHSRIVLAASPDRDTAWLAEVIVQWVESK